MIDELKLKYTLWYIVDELMEKYGCNITLGELFLHLTKDRSNRCPNCGGRGFVTIRTLDIYGSEGCVKDIKCDLCKGTGFTNKKMKPRMVQDGWEEA